MAASSKASADPAIIKKRRDFARNSISSRPKLGSTYNKLPSSSAAFPSRLADLLGGRDDKHHRLNFEKAVADMPNAYLYEGQRLTVTSRNGDATSQDEIVLKPKNQFATEIDHMADCVLKNRKPRTPGKEGVQDQVLMEAIYESAKTGAPVELKAPDSLDAFRGPALPDED